MNSTASRKWTPKSPDAQILQKSLYKNPPEHPPRTPAPAVDESPIHAARAVSVTPPIRSPVPLPRDPSVPRVATSGSSPRAAPATPAPRAAPPLRVPRRPLAAVDIFQQALAHYPRLPEQPATLRREALELVASLGGGLICGEPERLLQALGDSRVAVGRITALAQLLAPALSKELDPALHQLNRSLGYFARYLRNQQS